MDSFAIHGTVDPLMHTRLRECELALRYGAFFFPVHLTKACILWLSNFPLVPRILSPADVPVDICTK